MRILIMRGSDRNATLPPATAWNCFDIGWGPRCRSIRSASASGSISTEFKYPSTPPAMFWGQPRYGSNRTGRSGSSAGITSGSRTQRARALKPVPCQTFITECTFGLPIFRWDSADQVFGEINAWWRENQALGRTSILLAYSLGKSQRVLAGLDASIGPILLHGAVHGVTEVYRAAGVALPATLYASVENAKLHRGHAIVVAPPAAMNTVWSRKFSPISIGIASGWMRIRGFRRRRAADRGFVLSDHVDFPALLETIEQTQAEHVIATHGYTDSLVQLLRERGKGASAFATRFGDDEQEPEEERMNDESMKQGGAG